MEKILVVVDAQNDFITGSLGSKDAVRVVPEIVKKVENHDGPIILTLDSHDENYMDTQEGRNLPVKHCVTNSRGWDIEGSIWRASRGKDTDMIFKSSFGSITLGNYIYRHFTTNENEDGEGLDIEFVGYVLDICVISNALLLKTWFPEARISVDTRCCAATSREAFGAACTVLKSCQVEVR